MAIDNPQRIPRSIDCEVIWESYRRRLPIRSFLMRCSSTSRGASSICCRSTLDGGESISRDCCVAQQSTKRHRSIAANLAIVAILMAIMALVAWQNALYGDHVWVTWLTRITKRTGLSFEVVGSCRLPNDRCLADELPFVSKPCSTQQFAA